MRRLVLFAGLVAPLACGGDDQGVASDETTGSESTGDTTASQPTSETADSSSSGGPVAFCAGPTALQYDPAAARIDAFPDDVFTVDEDTPSGVRVDLRPGQNVTLDDASMPFAALFEDASTVDGFGTTSGAYVRISGPLDAATLPASRNEVPTVGDALVLVDLDAEGGPALVPFEWEQVAEDPGMADTTLLLEPMAPLHPTHRHGFALTTAALGEDGECVAPSAAMISMLDGSATDPALARVAPRVGEFVDALVDLGVVDDAFGLSAAIVFTTQSTTDDSATIAAEIRDADAPVFTPVGVCTDPDPESPWIKCTGTLDVLDYTGADEHLAADLSAQGGYDLPVTIWLPTDATGALPTFVYGHGLAGERDEADALADFVAPIGAAVIAVDAPKHGLHPDAGGVDVLDFFGLSLNLDDPLDALKLRDNFRQGTYDRLQLVAAIGAGIDANGDAEVDLDIDRLHYLGVSLGGIMGAELVAFAPEFDTATLIVPGARVGNIVAEGEQFSLVVDVFASMASDGALARFFPLLQTAIDRGDAGVYTRHIAAERLPGFDEATPQVLVQMVLEDDTVPNSANAFFARGVGAPLLGDELLPIGGVPLQPELPTVGNLDRAHTWGLFQFDIMDAEGTMASHGGIARSIVAQTQITRFVTSQLDAGVSEIIDPYRELDIKP
jgi:hypothetical protein